MFGYLRVQATSAPGYWKQTLVCLNARNRSICSDFRYIGSAPSVQDLVRVQADVHADIVVGPAVNAGPRVP